MRFDLVIVGGGLAGLSLACALSDSALKIALVEHSRPLLPQGWDTRVYAISPANAVFFAEIGAWDRLDRSRLSQIRAMDIRGDAGACLSFSAYECGIPELGWIIEASRTASALWSQAETQENLTLFCPAAPVSLDIDDEQCRLELDDGHCLVSSLLVGADGRESWVRKVRRIKAVHIPYHEHGVVANFECARPHRGIARQWFRDDGVLAWLPLPGNRISVVWSAPDAQAADLLALPAEEFCRRVSDAGDRILGTLHQITPQAAFPLSMMHVPQDVTPRLALIGDAAHGIHPLSGHGINLGLRDASALASLLKAAPEWQDIGALHYLRRYQRLRLEETVLMQSLTHTLQRLFHEKLPGLQQLRHHGMNLVDTLPVLKNTLVRYATGTF